MPLRHILLDTKYRSAWRRTLQLWKPLAIWTIVVWLMVTVLLAPAITTLIYTGFIRGDRLVISNEEILYFLITPSGLIFLFLIGGISVIASIIRYSGIFQIVTCKMKQYPLTVRELTGETIPLLPRLFRLSLIAIGVALAAGIVLIIGFLLIYTVFLSGQDINYYLYEKPPEWTYSLIAGAIWLLICGAAILYVISRLSLALPAFLDRRITIRMAVQSSWHQMGNQSVKLLKMIGITFTIWFLLLILSEALLLSTTILAIEYISGWISHPRAVSSIAGAYLILSQSISAIIGFFGFSFISVLLTKFYHEESGLKKIAPEAPRFTELRAKLTSRINTIFTPVRAAVLILLLLIGGLGMSALLASQIPETDSVKILSHRAGPPPAPENTIAALDLAISQGADIAEIDVMRTADGTVVVFHDRDMMRMAQDPRRISDVTYDKISGIEQLPAGDFSPESRTITTLEEMLLHGKNRIEFMVELKYYGFDPDLANDVVQIIRETGMEDQASIASLQIDPVRELALSNSDLSVGYISAISIGNLARLPVDYIAVQHQQITGSLIRAAHQNEIEVYAWTVNQPEQVAGMINMGVDGIITDFPEMAVRVSEEFSSLSLPERFLLSITGWQSQTDQVHPAEIEVLRPE
ncbi:glycerophosphodiester phosphodiesterase family protein [Rhodohalobacter sp. SW132]|uniref:glycerophosphodiester phosphodiesterase family protein n=1 Tax=Rhodohalobacter sp. SW132 TaxID=2293433 RepID=UPI0011C07A60|nr:glycerophosphodiester phosphodiesterase family protein [Rhodohalobacter sp. SW132]